MQLLGLRPGRLLAAWTALGALAALLPALWMWGFTVDDALISVRYARHLADGLGWRFNAHGPSTDGVTPLPWPLVLASFARAGALVVLARAKGLGLAAWVLAGAALGRAAGRVDSPAWTRVAALATMALSVPLAAHAVSGMETAVATSLATFAALRMDRPRTTAILAGLAASLRPEMAPWACALALGAVTANRATSPVAASANGARDPRLWLEVCALALGPFVACAVIRASAWGHPAPLALLAKPSDVAHGLAYVGAACVVSLVPVLVLAPIAVAREPRALAIVLAALVHLAVVVVVGGDWMPYARLVVPVLPSLVYAAVLAGRRAHAVPAAARATVAVLLGVTLVARGGTSGRSVGPDRAALVATARPWLEGVQRLAALDIGWPSAATEAEIIDLAGLTDPEIAALRGGHTSKRVDARFLLARSPDALLIDAPRGLPPGGLSAWQDAATPRAVEARLLDDEDIAAHFIPVTWLPLGPSGGGYILLRAR
jgi:uncharacterized membrane protein YhdT